MCTFLNGTAKTLSVFFHVSRYFCNTLFNRSLFGRVNSDNPEQMCIGGTSTAIRDINQCGDFAGKFFRKYICESHPYQEVRF